MGGDNFIMSYVQACTAGKLTFSECGPVWQFTVIAVMLAVAIMFLIFLIMGAQGQSAKK